MPTPGAAVALVVALAIPPFARLVFKTWLFSPLFHAAATAIRSSLPWGCVSIDQVVFRGVAPPSQLLALRFHVSVVAPCFLPPSTASSSRFVEFLRVHES